MSAKIPSLPDPAVPGRRDDFETARVIELAIELQRRRGRAAAARFLTAYGASFRLTVRVLSEPRLRRLC